MNIQSIIVLLVVIAIAGFALRSIIKSKKNGGGCNGNCAECCHHSNGASGSCSSQNR